MATPWSEQGCPVCRAQWERGEQPPELAGNVERHARLHQCPVCGSYWEQEERGAHVVQEAEAREAFPDAFGAHFQPANELETALVRAQSGGTPMEDFLKLFVTADIAVPSGGEITRDGQGFQPLLFDKEGTPMVACFTALGRAGRFAHQTPYCLQIKAGEFLRRIPSGHGLVVNPGESVGFDIAPDGIQRIVAELI